MDITWPTSEGAVLLWAEVILGWTFCVYALFGNQPIIEEMGAKTSTHLPTNWKRISALRAVATALVVLLITTWTGWKTFGLIASLSLLALGLPFARVRLAERSKPWGAELEVIVNLLAVGLSALLIGDPGAAPLRGLVSVPVSSDHLAAIIAVAAIMLFMATGGTHIVRGILARVDAIPLQTEASAADQPESQDQRSGAVARPQPSPASGSAPASQPAPGSPLAPAPAALGPKAAAPLATPAAAHAHQLDSKEYNRGRVIGIIERVIMTVVVAVGAYAALMFLIGAKGLIRSSELAKHEFAEYFLIGTLASAAIAILFGLLIQALIHTLW